MALSTPKQKELLAKFGRLIFNKRKELGYSQEELSRRAGYKMNMANLWEKGTKLKLNPDEFQKIATCLNFSDEELAPYQPLVSGEGDRTEYKATKDAVIQKSLRLLLERQGVTQTELARQLGVVPSHISAWLNGAAEPKIGHLKKLVELYFPIVLQAEAMEFLLYGTPYPDKSFKQQAELWKKKYLDEIERQQKGKGA